MDTQNKQQIIILVDSNVNTIAQLKEEQLQLQKQKMDCRATYDLIPYGNKVRTPVEPVGVASAPAPVVKTIPAAGPEGVATTVACSRRAGWCCNDTCSLYDCSCR
jgi:hypothetical protein